MTLLKLRDWLEVIGLFSVVASLIFVGLAMKQSQDIAIADQYQARFDSYLAFSIGRLENADILQITGENWRKEYEKLPNFPPDAKRALAEMSDERFGALHLTFQILLKQLDNLHYQYQSGFLTEESWLPLRKTLRRQIAGGLRFTYDVSRIEYRESYKQLVDGMIAEIDDNRTSD